MEDHTRQCAALRPDAQPDVDFCGYTIPRPSEPKMHMRLQTRQDLRKVSTQITDAYRKELKAFKRKNRTN
ncbi:putative DNA-directed RNA polymerases I and III subunit RPAC2 [Phytophthora ramorum]|uniref:putative DNA-directed RNA polymerases I and III subunit RPAC2 n=1 Tax=Phytophthora ramorum TaxID=164328 RepID=UPI0030AFFD80|nr:putative DNA-directed RNA polymerases I and III subunit RPAC2 [Phytophthora ramorum]